MNFAEAIANPAGLLLVGTLCMMGEAAVPLSFLAAGVCAIGSELKEAILQADTTRDPITQMLEPLIRHSLAKLDQEGQRIRSSGLRHRP